MMKRNLEDCFSYTNVLFLNFYFGYFYIFKMSEYKMKFNSKLLY